MTSATVGTRVEPVGPEGEADRVPVETRAVNVAFEGDVDRPTTTGTGDPLSELARPVHREGAK